MTRYKKSQIKKKLLFTVSLTFLAGLCVCFFGQFNSFILANYEINNCEKQINQLSATNEELKMNFVEANRVTQIENIAKEFNFEKTEKVHYIKAISEVAANK